jgi:hypothetical protein
MMDPVVPGSEGVSNFCDQRWCWAIVSETVSSLMMLSAAPTERVRPARNTAAAEILKPVMVASREWIREIILLCSSAFH